MIEIDGLYFNKIVKTHLTWAQVNKQENFFVIKVGDECYEFGIHYYFE